MADLLLNVALVSTALFGLVVDAVEVVVDNDLLLVFFSIAIVGSGVGLFQRLRG